MTDTMTGGADPGLATSQGPSVSPQEALGPTGTSSGGQNPSDPQGNLTAAANAAQGATPATIVGAAQAAQTSNEAAYRAQIIEAYRQATRLSDVLNGLDPVEQAATWKAYGTGTRDLLTAAGYKPPDPSTLPYHSSGFWGSIWHNALHYGDTARHDVAGAAAGAAGAVGNVFSFAAAPELHALRAAFLAADQASMRQMEQGGSGLWTNPLTTFDPDHLMQAWRASSDGASTFDPYAVRYVQSEYGLSGMALSLAKMQASGKSLQDILSNIPQAQRASAYSVMQTTPHFSDAVGLLSDSHLGLGQVMFGGPSPEQIHQMFQQRSAGVGQALNLAGQVIGSAPLAASVLRGNVAGVGAAVSAVGTASVLAGPKRSVDTATTVSPFGIQVHPLSGIADGIFDWYANPLQQGLAANSAFKAGQHTLTVIDAQGFGRDIEAHYRNNPAAVRAANWIADAITKPLPGETGRTAAHANLNNALSAMQNAGMPNAGKLLPDLKAAYPDIKASVEAGHGNEAIGRFLASETGLINLFRGKGAQIYRNELQLPHLTVPAATLAKIRTVGANAIFTGRVPRILGPEEMPLGEFARKLVGPDVYDAAKAAEVQDPRRARRWAQNIAARAVTLMPRHNLVPLASDDIGLVAQEYARQFLPERLVQHYVDGITAIPSTERGRRFDALMGLVDDGVKAAGVLESAAGRQWYEQWSRDAKDAVAAEHYSQPGNAEYVDSPGADPHQNAILDSQLAGAVALPDFRDLYKVAVKAKKMELYDMSLNSDLFDKFMSFYWKPAVLERPGFALRFSGEEVLSHILRNGPGAWAKGRLASTATGAAKSAHGSNLGSLASSRVGSAAGRLFGALTGHIPQEVLDNIKTPQELDAAISAFHVINYSRGLAGALLPEQYLHYAKDLADRGTLHGGYEDQVDMLGSHGVYSQDEHGLAAGAKRFGAAVPMKVDTQGPYLPTHYEDPERDAKFSWALSGAASAKIGRAVAKAARSGGPNEMLQAAIDWITGKSLRDALEYATAHGNEDEAAALHHQIAERQGIVNEFAALTKTPDGRLVATGEATQDEANRAMAQFVVNHILHLTTYRDAEGNLQALEAAGALPLKRPWRIVSGPDAGRDIGVVQRGSRNIGSADETVGTRVIRTHPYEDIAPGDVRLFHPHTHDLDRATSQSGAPGRSWTPNFSIAARQARTGNVYWMDVPQAVAERMGYHAAEGIATSAEDFTREAMAAQTAGLNVTHHGYLESGDIAHANMDEAGLPNRIVDMLSRGLVPSNAELARIPREHYPDSFIAPNQMAVVDPKHVIRDFLNKGMKVLVGRPANWMSRQPIWTHNYVMARVELAKAFKAYNIPDASGDLAHDVASERATNASIPYIHDARTRSQFSAITRTLMPFWFAQEQFYKRWGRLFLRNPEAFYKLQLTMNGLRSVGFIQKDAYGQDSFVYPGSPLVLKFLAGAFGGSLPVSVGFQSEVAQLNPTLATGGAPYPSFGPLVTLPLSLLASYFPAEFSGAAALTAGPNAPKPDYSDSPLDLAFKGVMGQLFPSVVTRAFGALQATDDPTSSAYSSQYMTAMVQAVQQLEATGHGLPANATFAERDKFVALVHNWAKTLMYARAAFGFIAPATPNFKIADTGLGKEFTDLLSVMPDYQTAVTAFIKAHGQEASPYTVFASTTAGPGQSGAYVPATQKALEFIASNQPFFDKYPQAAPWFFPLSTGKGPFEDQAYQNELQMGMRSRRAFGPPALRAIGHDWLDEVLYGMSANVYFPLEQQIKAQEAADPNQAPELKAAWTAWSTQFKTDHPLFAANLTNSDARTRRTAVIGDLQKALKDDALPDTPQAQHIKVLMDAYQMVVDFHTANANISADRSQFTANWKAFVEWGTAYAGLFPDVAPFFNGVLSLQKVG